MDKKIDQKNVHLSNSQELPRMYREFASWFYLITKPDDYAEEAAFFHKVFLENCQYVPVNLLELGSGGGNNALHLKHHFHLTLVDLSKEMLALSRQLNPECEHIEGDMRLVKLNRDFDAIFIHDAIMYMCTLEDLKSAIETAYVHCKVGGTALFAPDFVRETFKPSTQHGGHDGQQRALRYLEWTYDPDESDTTYIVDFTYLLREKGNETKVAYDRHVFGLFSRRDWVNCLEQVGFEAKVIVDNYDRDLFVGIKTKE